MFKTRLASGVVLVILALIFLIAGGPVLLAVTTVISLIGMFELYRVFHIEKSLPGMVGYLALVIFDLNLAFGFLWEPMILYMGFLILLLAVYVFSYPKFRADQIMAAFFAFFYVGVMLSFIYQTRMLSAGVYLVWLIFLCSWGSDTCAYCVWMLIGRHKMSPKLSPKKSVEGAVGGVVGAALLTALFGTVFRQAMEITTAEVWALAAIAAVGALISMVGDLAASAIKRNYDIKDYGTLIPGHGGILDRFDSVIITAPIVYFLAATIL